MEVTIYGVPAIVALLAKGGIYFYARSFDTRNFQTRLYLLFLFSLSIQNLAEILIFASKAQGLPSPTGGILYFGTSIVAVAFLLHLALTISTNWRGGFRTRSQLIGLAALYVPAVVLEVILWSSSALVAGFEPMNYTYTKIPGPLYFLFELYVIGYLLVVAGLLIYGVYKQDTTTRRLQNKLILVSLIPFFAIVLSVIILQRFGFHNFNTTVTLPIAVAFFLAMTAYATHQYRVFDIAFYVPWSKIRKRKTAFYQRIQATIAEISQLDSVKDIVRLISETLHCPVALVGGSAQPMLAMSGEHVAMARFPLEDLKKIDRIVVANEIVDAAPALHAQMKNYRVAAVVPFFPHSQSTASWMMLGDSFSEQVYTPLDFRAVEELFTRIADRFLDRQLFLKSQIDEAKEELDLLRRRLAMSWDQSAILHRELVAARNEIDEQKEMVRQRDDELATAKDTIGVLNEKRDALRALLLREQLRVVRPGEPTGDGIPGPTFDDHIAEFEAWLIRQTLKHHNGDRNATAQELGLRLNALLSKIERYGIDKDDDDPEEDLPA